MRRVLSLRAPGCDGLRNALGPRKLLALVFGAIFLSGCSNSPFGLSGMSYAEAEERLQELVDKGTLTAFEAPSRDLPSMGSQRMGLARLPPSLPAPPRRHRR